MRSAYALSADHIIIASEVAVALLAVDVLHLIDDVVADAGIAKHLPLIGIQIEDLSRGFESVEHFIIAESGTVHSDDLIKRDKAVAIDVGCGGSPRLFCSCGIRLGFVDRSADFAAHFFFVVILKPVGFRADEIAAACAKQTADESAKQAVLLG